MHQFPFLMLQSTLHARSISATGTWMWLLRTTLPCWTLLPYKDLKVLEWCEAVSNPRWCDMVYLKTLLKDYWGNNRDVTFVQIRLIYGPTSLRSSQRQRIHVQCWRVRSWLFCAWGCLKACTSRMDAVYLPRFIQSLKQIAPYKVQGTR